MRNFRSPTANRVLDDAVRISMHVDTFTEINGSQKIALANLTLFAYMYTVLVLASYGGDLMSLRPIKTRLRLVA